MSKLEQDFDKVFPESRGIFGVDPYGTRRRAMLNYMQSVLTRAIKKEREAWINGKRCVVCGIPVEGDPPACIDCITKKNGT